MILGPGSYSKSIPFLKNFYNAHECQLGTKFDNLVQCNQLTNYETNHNFFQTTAASVRATMLQPPFYDVWPVAHCTYDTCPTHPEHNCSTDDRKYLHYWPALCWILIVPVRIVV